ncbi:MAG: GNAT family N-acetyltransferase [Phycisphaerales bacterium]
MQSRSPIEVRPADGRDDGVVADLINAFIRDSHVHFGERPQEVDEVRREREAAEDPWLVARVDGAFAGVARAHPWRAREAYRHTREVAVYVDPEHLRRGVARALYCALFDRLAGSGVHTLVAAIALPNAPSVALHHSVGFVEVGVFREVGWKHGVWRDVLFMQKPLAHGVPSA